MTSIRRASLLIVLAHPEDEISHGGVLAHLSQRGVRVTLACATDGEAGRPHPFVGPVDDLGALRAEELRLSCARLGIKDAIAAPASRLGTQGAAAARPPARPG